MLNNSVYGNFRTRTFADIFPNVEDFKVQYNATTFKNSLKEDQLNKIYQLLYAKYGNSNISYSDEQQCLYGIYSTMWQYGPSWEKRLEIQEGVRALTEDDLLEGNTIIYNHQNNPSSMPTTRTRKQLDTINDQRTAINQRGKMEAYAALAGLLEDDFTEEFIDRFAKFFIKFAFPYDPLWYKDPLEYKEEE